ncbi:hypothetical protein K7432_013548 [Basidiobolus ranarum]|uniref:C3H1-type domain-containing protein n=1 Tax=Basidiobolus ranarum TaxID=34480 RepID=A0ABR2VQN6_9FUNG
MTTNSSEVTWINTEWAGGNVNEYSYPEQKHQSNGRKREGRRMNKMVVLYKTELCRSFEETATCRYGTKCQFAHGEQELRPVMRHPKYKTLLCKAFWEQGSCPYGQRCCFIHISSSSSDTDPSDGNFSDVDSLENFYAECSPTSTTNTATLWWANSDVFEVQPSQLTTPYLPSKNDGFSSEKYAYQEDTASLYNRACRLPIFQKLSEC